MKHDHLIDTLSQNLQPSGKALRPQILFGQCLLACLLLAIAVTSIHGPRPDWPQAYFDMHLNLELFGIALVALAALHMLVHLSIPDRARGLRWKAAVLLTLTGSWVFLQSLHPWRSPESVAMTGDLTCTFMIISVAASLGTSFYFILRRTAPTRPLLSGLLCFGGATAFAAALQHLLCSVSTASHLLLHHAWPLFVAAVLGWLLGRKIFSWQ